MIAIFALYPGLYALLVGDVTAFDDYGLLAVALPNVRVMTEILYLALFAISFDFISGYTGYLSFGHSMFFGSGMFLVLGAREGLLPVVGPGTSFMALIVLAMLVTFAITVLIGSVSFKLTGVYFAMITLGFAEIAKLLMIELFGRESAITPEASETALGVPFVSELQLPLSGGGDAVVALHSVPGIDLLVDLVNVLPILGGWIGETVVFDSVVTAYYLIGIVTLLGYLAMQRIIHSPFGRVMIAIRENEERARAVGYDTYRFKLVAFGVSGAFAALAGALAAGFRNSGDPSIHFDVIEMSGDALLATIIGGMGTLAGPLFGFIFQRSLDEILGGTISLVGWIEATFPELVEATIAAGITVQDVLNNSVQGFGGLYVGIVFILFILYVPGGMLGTLRARLGGTLAEEFPNWIGRRVAQLRSLLDRDSK